MRNGIRHATMTWAGLMLVSLCGCGQLKETLGKEKTVIPPSIIKVTVPTETVKPRVPEVPAAPPAEGQPAGSPLKAPEPPAPPVEEKLLPQQLPAESPSGTMPIPVPEPKPKQAPPQPTSRYGGPPLLCSMQGPDRFYQGGVLTEDTTWSGEVLVEGALTVAPQATLTIAPGTVVRFRRPFVSESAEPLLLIQGRLLVTGTQERKVRFIPDISPYASGEWQGILLLASEKKNQIEHCLIEGAECGLDAAFANVTIKESQCLKCRTGFRFQDSLASVTGGGVSDCDVGFNLVDSEIDIRDAAFSGNRQGVVAFRTSLHLLGGQFRKNTFDGLIAKDSRVKLAGNLFLENSRGVTLASCEGSLTGSRIAGSSEFGLSLAGSRVRVNGNEISGNLRTGIQTEDNKGVLWGNAISDNGQYDLYHGGPEELKAMGNWWGSATAADVRRKIYDRGVDNRSGRVLATPYLQNRPELRLPKGFAK